MEDGLFSRLWTHRAYACQLPLSGSSAPVRPVRLSARVSLFSKTSIDGRHSLLKTGDKFRRHTLPQCRARASPRVSRDFDVCPPKCAVTSSLACKSRVLGVCRPAPLSVLSRFEDHPRVLSPNSSAFPRELFPFPADAPCFAPTPAVCFLCFPRPAVPFERTHVRPCAGTRRHALVSFPCQTQFLNPLRFCV